MPKPAHPVRCPRPASKVRTPRPASTPPPPPETPAPQDADSPLVKLLVAQQLSEKREAAYRQAMRVLHDELLQAKSWYETTQTAVQACDLVLGYHAQTARRAGQQPGTHDLVLISAAHLLVLEAVALRALVGKTSKGSRGKGGRHSRLETKHGDELTDIGRVLKILKHKAAGSKKPMKLAADEEGVSRQVMQHTWHRFWRHPLRYLRET